MGNASRIRQSNLKSTWPVKTMVPLATMRLNCGECRARSDRTSVRSDFALHSPLLYHFCQQNPTQSHL